jgi:hypothetical protein
MGGPALRNGRPLNAGGRLFGRAESSWPAGSAGLASSAELLDRIPRHGGGPTKAGRPSRRSATNTHLPDAQQQSSSLAVSPSGVGREPKLRARGVNLLKATASSSSSTWDRRPPACLPPPVRALASPLSSSLDTMATTFDQRAKLHSRLISLHELVLSQEASLS